MVCCVVCGMQSYFLESGAALIILLLLLLLCHFICVLHLVQNHSMAHPFRAVDLRL